MAITITNVTRENGATCDHIVVTVNDEGTVRTFKTSFTEVDSLSTNVDPLEIKRTFVLLWANYRRNKGRPIINVDIA